MNAKNRKGERVKVGRGERCFSPFLPFSLSPLLAFALLLAFSPALFAQTRGVSSFIGTLTFPEVTTNNLAEHWTLNETNGARMGSLAVSSLYPSNAVSYTGGVKGNAARFTRAASNFLAGTDLPALRIANEPATVWCWVFLHGTNSGGTGNQFWLMGKDGVATEWGLYYEPLVARYRFALKRTGGTYQVDANVFGAPPTNQWHLVAARFEHADNRISISVNGGLWDYKMTSGTVSTNGSPFTIGGLYQTNAFPIRMNGLIDSAAITKSVLSGYQMQRLYAAGLGFEYPWDSESVMFLWVAPNGTDNGAGTPADPISLTRASTGSFAVGSSFAFLSSGTYTFGTTNVIVTVPPTNSGMLILKVR